MTYSLEGVSLGKIQAEDFSFTSGVLPINAATGKTDGTEAVRGVNTFRTVTLSGVFTGDLLPNTDVTTLSGFAAKLKEWNEGDNSVGAGVNVVSYISDLQGTFNIAVLKAEGVYIAGRPGRIEYTIQMVEVT